MTKRACVSYCPSHRSIKVSWSGIPKSDLLQKNSLFDSKAASPAAIAVNNAGSGHGELVGDDPFLNDLLKAPHRSSTDDSGAVTGLRGRPDYGESDSYTSETNEVNSKTAERTIMPEQTTPQSGAYSQEPLSLLTRPIAEDPHQPAQKTAPRSQVTQTAPLKPQDIWDETPVKSAPSWVTGLEEEESKGIMAGYHVAVETPKVVSGVEMYISSVEFDPENATRVEKFAFTADRTKAATFHRLTASEVVRQLGGPDFGVWAKAVLAADSSEMFKAVEALEPKARPLYRREIEWARQHLKKQKELPYKGKGIKVTKLLKNPLFSQY